VLRGLVIIRARCIAQLYLNSLDQSWIADEKTLRIRAISVDQS